MAKCYSSQIIALQVAMITCFLLLPQAHQKYVLLTCRVTLYGSLAAIITSVFFAQ